MVEQLEHLWHLTAVRSIPPKEIGNRGYLPSLKVDTRIAEYESQIERDFYILLNHADDVIKFQHQPVTIQYKDSIGKNHKYTPDTFVQFSDNTGVIVEIKEYRDYIDNFDHFLPRWLACQQWCKDRGFEFIVLTDKEIRTPRFHNVWLTLSSSKVSSNDRYIQKLNQIIPETGILFNECCHLLVNSLAVSSNKASQILCYAIYHGLISIDNFSEEMISGTSMLRLSTITDIDPFKPLLDELDYLIMERGDISDIEEPDGSVLGVDFEVEIFDEASKAKHRELIVQEFLKTPKSKRNHEWRDRFSRKHKVGISTVYSWIKKYKEDGIKGLKSKYSGSSSSWDNYTMERMEKGRLKYLTDYYTIKRAYNKVLCKDWNNENDPPSYETFRRYVNNNTSYVEKEIHRKGQLARHKLEPSTSQFQGAIMPFQVVQLDNTDFDLFQTDKFGRPIGVSKLCAAIDVYTRQITGFELTLTPINRQSIMETLIQTILPKDRYLSKLYNNDEYSPIWPMNGIPLLILVDNGMDYRSKDVRRFCMEYDIILEFAPLRKPRYKPYIESWFNTLRSGIENELSSEGYRPSLLKRVQNRDLDPESNAIFSEQQCELWLVSWILDEYHYNNPYDDLLPAPAFRYEEYVLGEGPMILPQIRQLNTQQIDDIVIKGLMSTTRTLNDRIRFCNLTYGSPELNRLYKKLGKIKITILYDNRDIRTIWCINPITNRPLTLGLSVGWANAFITAYDEMPISYSAWSQEVRDIKKRNRKKMNLNLFRRERGREYREKLRTTAQSSKSKRRKAEVRNEQRRKLQRKGLNKTELSPPKVIKVNEDGEFVRNYVPIPDEMKDKLQKFRIDKD